MSIHVAVIGAYGSAGAAVAGELVDVPDVELTLIDDGEPGGGLCILEGCMPSKEVLSAAAHRYQARTDERLVGDPPAVDLDSVIERKDDHTLGWAAHRRESIHSYAERADVQFIHDTARFVDDRVIEAGGETIRPDYVVIATGSTPNVPGLPGIDEVEYMTSSDVLEARAFPESGIVMGLGYIGLEMVPYLAEAAGMELTVVEHAPLPIGEAPAAFGRTIVELYREEFGAEILTDTDGRRLEPTADGGVRLFLERADGSEETVEADQLFLFTGRRPSLEGLNLENTAIEPDGDWVDATMQARDDDRVFVVGDANTREPILHVAKEQGFHAADAILAHADGRAVESYENVHHHVIFTALGIYPFARIGHTAASAREAGHEVVTASRRAADDGVFKTKDVPDGLATLVVDANDGTVLGYQGLHYHADAMAKTLQVIVELGLDVREVPDRAYHPTTPELLDGLLREATAAVDAQ